VTEGTREDLVRKAWADFVNCQDDRYFGNRSKMDRQLDVLRKFGEHCAAAALEREDDGPLIEFFRTDGYSAYGWEGDTRGWSTEETAVHFLREHLACRHATDVGEVERQNDSYFQAMKAASDEIERLNALLTEARGVAEEAERCIADAETEFDCKYSGLAKVRAFRAKLASQGVGQ
jgi:hypothetical protein